MIKKTLTALALAGALLITGASAASATYNDSASLGATDTTIAPGVPITLTVNGIPPVYEGQGVEFRVTGGPGGATLASVVVAAAGASTTKTVTNGSASAQFATSTEGTHSVGVFAADGTRLASLEVQVSAAFADGAAGGTGGTSPSTGLPATGGEVPLTAIWIGAGALGLGAIAAVAATARRRSQVTR